MGHIKAVPGAQNTLVRNQSFIVWNYRARCHGARAVERMNTNILITRRTVKLNKNRNTDLVFTVELDLQKIESG